MRVCVYFNTLVLTLRSLANTNVNCWAHHRIIGTRWHQSDSCCVTHRNNQLFASRGTPRDHRHGVGQWHWLEQLDQGWAGETGRGSMQSDKVLPTCVLACLTRDNHNRSLFLCGLCAPSGPEWNNSIFAINQQLLPCYLSMHILLMVKTNKGKTNYLHYFPLFCLCPPKKEYYPL